jgi:hypothetical protein
MERIRAIEELIREIEASADPEAKAGVRRLVEALLEYQGAALERMLELIRESGPHGAAVIQSFAHDDLVASLLLLHGFHPEDFETRVRRAVDNLPNVELAGTADFRIRVRAVSSGGVSRQAIEEALYAAAPEAAGIEIDGLETGPPAFVPLEALLRA